MEFRALAGFAALALPPLILWTIFWRRRLVEPEPTSVLLELFLLGIFSASPIFALRFFNFDFPAAVSIPFFALLEESSKMLALIFGVEFNRARFDKWEDGFEFAIFVALGFAFAENIFYFFAAADGANFWQIYFFRSLATTLGHIIFTGTFGYFYATAFVAKKIVPKNKHEKPLAHFLRNLGKILRRPLHITIFHLLPQKDSAHGHTSGEVVLEGFLLAVALHAVFNSLLTTKILDQNCAFLSVPLLVGGGWWYSTRFRKIKKCA